MDFLVGLGVQTPEGKIVRQSTISSARSTDIWNLSRMYWTPFQRSAASVIIDFGCGKSYLTFAMYYYLHQLKKKRDSGNGAGFEEHAI